MHRLTCSMSQATALAPSTPEPPLQPPQPAATCSAYMYRCTLMLPLKRNEIVSYELNTRTAKANQGQSCSERNGGWVKLFMECAKRAHHLSFFPRRSSRTLVLTWEETQKYETPTSMRLAAWTRGWLEGGTGDS